MIPPMRELVAAARRDRGEQPEPLCWDLPARHVRAERHVHAERLLSVLDRFSFAGELASWGLRFTGHEEGGRVLLTAFRSVTCSNTGEPVRLRSEWSCPVPIVAGRADDELVGEMVGWLRSMVLHELDEAVFVDGRRYTPQHGEAA